MKTRKGRFFFFSVQLSMFSILVALYFFNSYSEPELDLDTIKLVIYVFIIFIIIFGGEWFRAFEEDSTRYKKYFFYSLMVIWVLFLPIFFKDMILGWFL